MNDNVIIGNELPEIAQLKARLSAVEAERDRAMAGIENMERIRVGLTAERDAAQKRMQDCETRMMRYAIELAEILGPDAAIDAARGVK